MSLLKRKSFFFLKWLRKVIFFQILVMILMVDRTAGKQSNIHIYTFLNVIRVIFNSTLIDSNRTVCSLKRILFDSFKFWSYIIFLKYKTSCLNNNCQNGALCVSVPYSDRYACSCTNTGFSGTFCEIGKITCFNLKLILFLLCFHIYICKRIKWMRI